MVGDQELAWRVRSDIRAALEAFIRRQDDYPGATVVISVASPLNPAQEVRNRLRQDSEDVLSSAKRSWSPKLEFAFADHVSIAVEFGTAATMLAGIAAPHISFEFPEDQYSQGLVRSRLEDSVVYSLMRESSSVSGPNSQVILLGSKHFPADPFLQLRRAGDEIWARNPHGRYQIRLVSRDDLATDQHEPLDLGETWQLLVAAARPNRASGRIEIAEVAGPPGTAPVTLDYNILGWGLPWDRPRQTRFPGITTDAVVVTKREITIAGRSTPSFIKTYECHTVDEAAALEQHFRDQQQVIQAINREARTSALEEVEVWRGAPLRASGTVTYYGAIPTTPTAAGPPATPHLQPDHRVFVSRPSLPDANWTDGGPSELKHLVALAHTLDIAHRKGAAHCDVKPENVRIKRQYERHDAAVAESWVVLIDSESFTQPNGQVRYAGLHTPSYTHPSFDPTALADPPLEQLVANDRLGFVAITITALLGPQVCSQVFAVPQPSPARRRETLTEAVIERLPGATQPVIELLMEPLEANSDRLVESVTSWSCQGWLSNVTRATVTATEPDPGVEKRPSHVDRALVSIIKAFDRSSRPNKEAAVEGELKRQVGLAFHRAFLQGLAIGSTVSVLLAIVLLYVLTQGGASS